MQIKSALSIAVLLLLTLIFPLVSSAEEGTAAPPAPAAWKTRVELSYVTTTGNTDTSTLAGKLDVRKAGPVNRYFLDGSYLRAESESVKTSDRTTLNARAERVITERNFALFSAGYLKDEFSGYDLRLFAGPGLGRDLVKTPAHRLQGILSLLYYHDEFSAGDKGTDDYPVGKVTVRYSWKARENVLFSETLDAYASLKDTERSFVDSVTAIEVKVNSRVSIGFNYTVNYQSEVPSPEIKHTDTTQLTTLIISL